MPLFDAGANVAVTCPPNKADEIASGLAELHGCEMVIVPEERLNAQMGSPNGPACSAAAAPPRTKGGTKKPVGGFAFAKQFKCECPKCLPAVVECS